MRVLRALEFTLRVVGARARADRVYAQGCHLGATR